jgi:UPF0755 protein
LTARLVRYAFALAVLGAITAAAVLWSLLQPVSDQGAEVLFEVRSGDSSREIAERLERTGLVRNARATRWWARLRGHAEQLHAGQYWLSPALSAPEILERFVSGRVATWQIVIPEGLTAAEIGARLAAMNLVDAADFAAVVEDAQLARSLGIQAASLEGYLFPETYRMPRGQSGRDVARILVGQFMGAWRTIEDHAAARGLSMHEVVTLASIVEKETGVAAERPMIASVFANRLRRSMRLESDPTVIYGLRGFDGNLRRRDIDDAANPYNTYQHVGLPPGPISNPGLDALRSVVEPANSDFLYFVSRNDGTHHFSSNYRDHVDAVDQYQRRRRSR